MTESALLKRTLDLFEKRKPIALIVGLVVFVLVVWADYVTTEEVSFSIFYLLPISLIHWFISPTAGLVMGVCSAGVWPVCDFVGKGKFPSSLIPYWDSAVKLGFYLIFTLILTRIKNDKRELERANSELAQALAEVKRLSGLLPICASCKRIRNEEGSWSLVEDFIQEHSEAQFSHGLCPECAVRLYPAYFKKGV